jgi:4-hydroxy-tetrahydrodipicolinate reductase
VIKILVNGASGKMGQTTVDAISSHPALSLVGTSEKNDDLATKIREHAPDVVVDFTSAHSGYENTAIILQQGARPVIGTSGFTEEGIISLQSLARDRKIGGVIAPNFSLGSIVALKCAELAVRYLPHVEIVELHHDRKADAPSGTALHSAERLSKKRGSSHPLVEKGLELNEGARGGEVCGVRVHSVRLPGYLAHQEYLFGSSGETLSIRHDSMNRESFMQGVCLACEKVMTLSELVYGLEYLMDW